MLNEECDNIPDPKAKMRHKMCMQCVNISTVSSNKTAVVVVVVVVDAAAAAAAAVNI